MPFIFPYPATFHHTLSAISDLTVSYHTWPILPVCFHILSTMFYHVFAYLTVSYHIGPNRTISFHILHCMSFHVFSYFLFLAISFTCPCLTTSCLISYCQPFTYDDIFHIFKSLVTACDVHTFLQITCGERSCRALQITCEWRAWRYVDERNANLTMPTIAFEAFRGGSVVAWFLMMWQPDNAKGSTF